jgi:carboxylesterase type B
MWLPFAMTTVSIADGSLKGRSTPSSAPFLGIPFAQAPDSQNWPAYNMAERAMAILGRDVAIERDPNRPVRQAWNS